ncbi:hypothetical protein CMI37_31035 [Candidatus Pacearchaeota archaeon]|nr:hypothetical protein [Candidatus Pacearchaeota archaeon]|tara:strand:- start:1537 stop:1839 length:303 start_codon:yes stop_codon:yes gene_type:complete
MKHIIFHEGNTIKGQGSYSNPDHIPHGQEYLETTEELVRSEYPLEIYDVSGGKKVRINAAEKIRIDTKKAKIKTIRDKVEAGQVITNEELAYLMINKESL